MNYRYSHLCFSFFVFFSIHSYAGQGIFTEPAPYTEQQYRVAILDRFFPPAEGFSSEVQRDHHLALYGLTDIDEDEQAEPFYHGDLVKMLAAHRNINFISYPIRNNQAPMADILENLRKISTRMSVQPIDALVLSWESSTLISSFEQPLQKNKARQYIETVKSMGKESQIWLDTWKIIQELELLTLKGVAVYTIAGNGGRRMINTFSFAQGVITVGASEQELEHFVANNVFVDTYARAAYQLVRVDNEAGEPLGYDLDDDHCIDIPLSRLTGYSNTPKEKYPKTFWKVLRGSSFAAPAAMKMALLQGMEEPCS
ncbi:hypothetical protein [Parendozoicomonas sp. Alg238-R29]|uniref:hypothetical protein n=1 Tax=Parendozoicomonas sp. Alg238-R29 TaxID=2993446 RepID=UPI00248E6F6F|nr:hypothetical protein [Parendozoicomonas sp. Alg238-R29]